MGQWDWCVQQPNGCSINSDWPRDPHARAIEQAIDPRHPIVALALLQPVRLTRSYELVIKGEASYEGRPVIRVRGFPTYSAESVIASGNEDAPVVFEGADEAEFVVDEERGVILRWAGLTDGIEFESVRFTAIDFDVDIDDWCFDPLCSLP